MNKQVELLSIRKGKFFNRKQDGQNQVGTTALFWTASKAILIPNRQVTSLSPSWHNKENYPFFSVLAQSSKFKLNCFYRSGFWFFPLWWQYQVHPSKCRRESGSILLCPLHNTAQQVQCRWHKRYRFHPRVRKTPWRRAWQPPPVFLPGESHGQRSLVDYGLWGHKESDMTDHYIAISLHNIPSSRVFHCRRLVSSIRSFIIKYSGFWQEDKTEI